MAFNETMRRAFEPAAKNGLTATERHVLLELCNGANKTARLFPSHNTIAERCGYSRATVIRAMAKLEALGWIQRERRRRKDGTRTTDLLTVTAPAVNSAPDRLLPLMAVVKSTGKGNRVAQCNPDKVAPCDLDPGKQSRTEQQQNPISSNLTLGRGSKGAASPVVDKPAAVFDPQVIEGFADLARLMTKSGDKASTPLAQRGLARRAG